MLFRKNSSGNCFSVLIFESSYILCYIDSYIGIYKRLRPKIDFYPIKLPKI